MFILTGLAFDTQQDVERNGTRALHAIICHTIGWA